MISEQLAVNGPRKRFQVSVFRFQDRTFFLDLTPNTKRKRRFQCSGFRTGGSSFLKPETWHLESELTPDPGIYAPDPIAET